MKESITAGGVVVNKDGKILIVNQHSDSWSLPKGHVEPGENLLSAAKREISEESGIRNLTYIKQLPSYKRNRIARGGSLEDKSELKTLYWFLFRTDEEVLSPHDPDNPEAKWVDKTEVTSLLTHPKDKEFFQKIMFELET